MYRRGRSYWFDDEAVEWKLSGDVIFGRREDGTIVTAGPEVTLYRAKVMRGRGWLDFLPPLRRPIRRLRRVSGAGAPSGASSAPRGRGRPPASRQGRL